MQALILKKDALLLPVLCTRMLRFSRILWWKFGGSKIFSFLKLLFYFSFFPQCFWANVSMKPTVIEQANNNCESFNKSLIVFGKLSVCQNRQIGRKLKKWQWHYNFPIWDHRQTFFGVVLFLLSILVTGPSFMSISSLVLELWQFSFISDWPEIPKSEIPPSELCPISVDWDKLGIPNLAWTSLIKCYWMLQNFRVTAFTVSELLSENQQGAGKTPKTLFFKKKNTTLL